MNSYLKITVDTREPNHIIAILLAKGVDVQRKMITPGDYVLSSECAVERKTVTDFVQSVYNGRLFEQAELLKTSYTKPVIILEGDVETDLDNRKNPRSFWGALLRLEVDMAIPVINTPTLLHTADVLYTMAKRTQKKTDKITIQHKPKLITDKDRQIYVVSSLPGIGDELAMRLLTQFNSIRNIFKAKKSDLEDIDGIGKIKAEKIYNLLDIKYTE